MSHDDMEHYSDSLTHIARPADPSERGDADSVSLDDWEALYVYRRLLEVASYGDVSAVEERIALGYAEYINMVVRDEGKGRVVLYTHTPAADAVLERVEELSVDEIASSIAADRSAE